MNIRNFKIIDNKGLLYHDKISSRVSELNDYINDIHNEKGNEYAIEYNFGSIIQPYTISFVVYNNPERNNNPYVFLYIKTNENRILIDEGDMAFFMGFANDDMYSDFIESIKIGYNRLPKYLFLGEQDIEKARILSEEYDER